MDGPLLIVNAYPDLTLPQGDEGNVLVLAYRARLRGIPVEIRTVHCGAVLPSADIYVVGGLEDEDQVELARRLDAGGVLRGAVAAGAAVLGLNSGFQVLGECFALPDGSVHDGVGLLDVRTWRGGWVEGPVVTLPSPRMGLPALSGYESHCGSTDLGDGVAPLASVDIGQGNSAGPGARVEGAVAGRVIGTYLHGPVLARNPELADVILASVLGVTLEPLPSSFGELSRTSRIAEARGYARRRRGRTKM